MNFSKGESSVSSGCKDKNSAKSLYFSKDDEDVIVLSDDEENESNKCMICYCTLTDSQRARVKALMIDCSDSTNIFNNYCNLLNIFLLETMKWDFQKEPMPFCSACLAMVKTLAQLSDKMLSIKSQINGILDIIKSEIVKSMKTKRSSKVTVGKVKCSRNSGKLTPLDKVDYCRSEVVKDMTSEGDLTLKTEIYDTSAEESEMEIGNTGNGEPEHVPVSCISQTRTNEEEYRSKHNHFNSEMYLPNQTYKLPVLKNSSRSYRQCLPAETQFQPNIREQITHVSSTQRGNSPDQFQSNKQSFNFVNSSTDMGNKVHEIHLNPSQMSQSVHPEFTQAHYYPAHKYNHHKSTESPAAILTEPESDESQSRMLQMEEAAAFEPWKYKGNVNSTESFSFKRFRQEEGSGDQYIQPPPPAPAPDPDTADSHSERDSGSGQYMNEGIEEDGSSFINANIHVIENSDTKESYCCRICQRRFTTRNSATSHMQAVHLKVKKLQCKFCTKTFFKKFNCLVHINKIHLKGRYAKINPESAVVYLVD